MTKKIISLEVSDTLREALRLEAYKRDLTISALIRAILIEKLNIADDTKEKKDE